MAKRQTCLPAGRRASIDLGLMGYFVYAISSLKQNYIYVGLTNNLDDRINRHNSGRERTTRFYAPFQIIYTEITDDLKSARKRERYLKSGAGKEFLKSLPN